MGDNLTAPTEDLGPVHFWVAGNSVNGDGAPGDEDWWNILTFTINAPGTIESSDSGATLKLEQFQSEIMKPYS